jgi:hypothetical protein
MRHKVIFAMLLTISAMPASADDMAKYQEESRSVVGPFMQQLQAENKKAMMEGGPDSAIKVCKDIAPKMAGDLSRKNGIRLTRVSLKVRNPLLGVADTWEQNTLKQFEARLAKGEKPETLEAAEIVSEPQGKYFRYMKGIVLQQGCVACHGTTEVLDASVKSRLAEDYPHDQAIGYSAGQVRGGVSIKRPL